MPVHAAVYVRVSLDRDGLSASPDRQRDDCLALCKSRGWTADVFVDRDVSAYSGVRRPQYEALLEGVRNGLYGAVVVWKVDRLSRSLADLTGTLGAITEANAQFVSISDQVDTSTPMGKASLHMAGVFAEMESDNTSYRVRRANQQAAQAGKWHRGGSRTYGFSRTGEIVSEEAERIREACARVIDGQSLWQIARDWNEAGVKTTHGNLWQSSSLGRLLRSPKLAGYRSHNGEVYRGTWTPIVSMDQWSEVQAQLDRGKRLTERRAGRHLLTGLIYCGICGGRLQRRVLEQGQSRFERYQCVKEPGRVGCGGTSASMTSADEVVRNRVIQAYAAGAADRAIAAAADEERRATLEQSLEEDLAALSQLVQERFLDRSIPDDAYKATSEALNDRIATTQAVLATRPETTPEDLSAEGLLAWWAGAEVADRRSMVRRLVDQVVLMPAQRRGGNRFDPNRLVIQWRRPPV